MRERPILFTSPMVRALLDGRKTQTRRVVKGLTIAATGVKPNDGGTLGARVFTSGEAVQQVRCPYGGPGDRLWVKEGWRYINHQSTPRGFEVCIGYEADGEDLPYRPSLLTGPGWEDKADRWPFRSRRWPSIHMPRWASRLTLEITDVRVERLQDISEADAEAEGAEYGYGEGASISQRRMFELLWGSINGPDSWAANPWVWAITFRVLP